MATRTSEQWEMIERWKAEHPDLSGATFTAPAPRPRRPPAPPPAPAPAQREDQREMIERWRRDHPELVGNRPAPAPRVVVPDRTEDSTRRYFDIGDTPLTVLAAFIVGCIIGGIAMTIITGIAFWGFAGG